jgi:hypothetical protein
MNEPLRRRECRGKRGEERRREEVAVFLFLLPFK